MYLWTMRFFVEQWKVLPTCLLCGIGFFFLLQGKWKVLLNYYEASFIYWDSLNLDFYFPAQWLQLLIKNKAFSSLFWISFIYTLVCSVGERYCHIRLIVYVFRCHKVICTFSVYYQSSIFVNKMKRSIHSTLRFIQKVNEQELHSHRLWSEICLSLSKFNYLRPFTV